jgi:hypothetical protein
MNGKLLVPDPPEAECFLFKRLTLEAGLDEADLFTLTWFYRSFGLHQDVPAKEHRYFSQRTIDVADRFISLWICFNSILRKHYGEGFSDREMIERAKNDFENAGGNLRLKEYYDTMCDPEYRENLKKLESLLPIRNMKNNTLVDMQNSSLIEVIYNIRCNLFHGRKDPTETNNRDFQLVRLAFYILAPLVIEYARQNDLIETCVNPEYQISQLENGIYFGSV